MLTFKISGQHLAEIIYSLPVLRAMGGGILYVDANAPKCANTGALDAIEPLLRRQPYILEVRSWNGDPIDYDLDQYRAVSFGAGLNPSASLLVALGLSPGESEGAWLCVEAAPHGRSTFARSLETIAEPQFWLWAYGHFADPVFLGTKEEHDMFESSIGPIDWQPTQDLFLAAQLIAGSSVFIGNNGSLYAIAEGLKHRAILDSRANPELETFSRPWFFPVRSEQDLGRAACIVNDWELLPQPIIRASAGKVGTASKHGLSVVIVTFNSAQTVEKCLVDCISELSPDDELIVIDNNSSDHTVSKVQAILAGKADCALIQNSSNIGYSAAANQAILISEGEHVLLLNPDAFVSAGSLSRMRSRFKDPYVAAVGPLSNEVAGDQYVARHLPERFRSGLAAQELPTVVGEFLAGQSSLTKFLVGFCLMIRRTALHKVGLLDDRLVLGGDDLEFSWRLRSHQFRIVIARDAFVSHRSGTSFRTLDRDIKHGYLKDSTSKLHDILDEYYGPGSVPSSEQLWGVDILPTREGFVAHMRLAAKE